MLKLVIGTDWTAVRQALLGRIASEVQRKQGGRILMVPELISHDTERRLCAAAGDTASRYAEVLSFTRLARRVSDSTGTASQVCLDNGGRLVAMAAATRQLHSRLKAYASVETRPEFLAQLVDAVDEFKRCCISSQDLAFAASQTEGTLAQKLEELSLILEAYDSLCARGKKDPRDQMTWLLEQLEDSDFAQNHVFYIDGFPDFTRQHMAILEHLIKASPMVTVGLNCDRPGSESMAFEKAGDTAEQILKCAKNAGVQIQIETVPGRADPKLTMCAALFQGPVPAHIPGLYTACADSEYAEVQAAAQRVLELTCNGARFRDIAVVCADMAQYQDLLELVFHRCGIPLYRSGTEDILRSTVVSTVLAALEAALEGFETRSTMRYLRSVLSPLDADTCDQLGNYAVLWSIRGGKWLEPWYKHPDGLNANKTAESESRLRALNDARALAMEPLAALQSDFRKAQNLSQQVQALSAFLNSIRLSRRLIELAEEMTAKNDDRAAQILNQLWEILLSALEQMEDVLGETVWEPEAFIRLLTLLLSQYDVGTIPPVLDAVSAGPVSAMRCHECRHLLVLGACEGALPGYGGSAGLLNDQERVALRQMGVPLTGGAMEGIQEEFAEIYGVFCGAKDTVWVSYPGGQASYVLRRLSRMSGEELQIKASVGAALTNGNERGAFLARWNDRESAKALNVEEAFDEAYRRAHYELGSVSPEHIRTLYGSSLRLSASQVDRQAECRMAYFLQYGLRAKELKEATVDPMEFGSFVHAVLEHTARTVMELGGFQQVSLEETLDIAMAFADRYAQEHFRDLDSARLSYLFRRNTQELSMVVAELWQELKDARFQPLDFELHFDEGCKMPAVELPNQSLHAQLRGYVDRVDIWRENGRNYFRVVDYKTGKKSFDYCDVFNGVGLQMLLYMFALERAGEPVLGKAPVGGGVLYFPARMPINPVDGHVTQEQAYQAHEKDLQRKGLLLNDAQMLSAMDPTQDMQRLCVKVAKDGSVSGDLASREQMQLLEGYVFRYLGKLIDDIASGNVEPNPYTRGDHGACTYCPYASVCKAKDAPGRRNYKTMTAQRFWEEVEKEARHDG